MEKCVCSIAIPGFSFSLYILQLVTLDGPKNIVCFVGDFVTKGFAINIGIILFDHQVGDI